MEELRATSSPQTYTISQLRETVLSGRLRVPQFQRSFRWGASDVQALFDSVLRGFPIGSILLWEREAPADDVVVGALRVHARDRADGLWVVDGQQRVTSLASAVDPGGADDPRFAMGYSLKQESVVRGNALDDLLVVPLPDLFDFSRALAWLTAHPEATDFAGALQDVTRRLNDVKIPVTVMKDADEPTLREVFDRINSRGKRLNAAEIFDAIHGGDGPQTTMDGIAQSVDAQTRFGVLGGKTVVQALLVRRHTDITRDIHGEFSVSRRRVSDFPEETESEAYAATERALVRAVRFLQARCGIPHVTFLPFRFQLLVLTRFFAFFPDASDRNRELLSRWFWRTSAGAGELGLSGSQTDLRSLAGLVRPGDESGSVQALLEGARLRFGVTLPDLSVFRATRSDSKMVLASLWSLHPVSPQTGSVVTREEIAEALEGESTPSAVVTDLVPTRVPREGAVAANKVISLETGRDLVGSLDKETDLASLLLDEQMVEALEVGNVEMFLALREVALRDRLEAFLTVRTGWGQEDTQPLSDFVFDEEATEGTGS